MSGETPPKGRPPEIEEISNRWLIHPVARRLVPVAARLGVTPNAVSLTGMGCGLLAGLAYHRVGHPGLAVAGLALMGLWHLMDGIDGQLARLTGTHSAFGKVLDGICDYVTFAAVYLGLGSALASRHGDWVWALVAVAGASHAAQGASYEAQRQDYDAFGWGRGAAAGTDGTGVRREAGAFGRLLGAYTALQGVLLGTDAATRAGLAAASADPRARAAYRARFAPALRTWSVLSANCHTAAIFVFAVSGAPLWYFVFEAVGLNALLAVLLGAQRARSARFVSALALSPAPSPTGTSLPPRSPGAAARAR